MANVKRVVIPLTAAGLIAAMGIGGAAIAAYLTDSETATNTFTVGKVKAELEEKNWPGNDSDVVKHIEPNKEIPKDPQVENTGNNPLVSFLKVYSPVALVDIVTPSQDGKTATKSGLLPQEIFFMKDKDAAFDEKANSFHVGGDHKWLELPNQEKGENDEPYLQAQTQTDGTIKYVPITADAAKAALWNAKFYTMKKIDANHVKMEGISAEEAAKLPIAEVYTIAADKLADAKAANFEYEGTAAPADYTALSGSDTVQKRLDDARIYKPYVFGHKSEVNPHVTTETIFDKVQFKNIIEGELDGRSENIVIDTYAIQSRNVIAAEGTTGVDTTNLTNAQLEQIYNLFIAQGTAGQGDEAQDDVYRNVSERPANSNNDKDIQGKMSNETTEGLDVQFATTHVKIGETITPTVVYTVNNEVQDGTGKYTFSLVNPTDSQYVELNPTTGAVKGLKLTSNTSNTIKIKGETTGNPKATVEIEISVVNPTAAPAPTPTPGG